MNTVSRKQDRQVGIYAKHKRSIFEKKRFRVFTGGHIDCRDILTSKRLLDCPIQ